MNVNKRCTNVLALSSMYVCVCLRVCVAGGKGRETPKEGEREIKLPGGGEKAMYKSWQPRRVTRKPTIDVQSPVPIMGRMGAQDSVATGAKHGWLEN